MGIGLRYYLFPENEEPLRMSQRLVGGLAGGKDALPQFAGTRQRMLGVVLDTDDRAPGKVIRQHTSVWDFDGEGRIIESLRKNLADAMDFVFAGHDAGKVIQLDPKLKRKRYEERNHWQLSDEDWARVSADIWPDGKAKPLKQAKGVSKRHAPLTYEARQALSDITKHFTSIEFPMWNLTEPALKGLAHEGRKRADEGDNPELNRAVAEIAERRLRHIARRRSSKGIWYGLVEVWEVDQNGGETNSATYHRKCDGQRAAEIAARELLVLHADKVSGNYRVTAAIETDLEWDEAARWSVEG